MFLKWVSAATVCLLFSSCASPRRGTETLNENLLELPPFKFSGEVFVDFNSRVKDYQKLAVVPFKAPVELAGASLSDVFATELLKTARYDLVERGQIESILKEQEFRLSGVTDDSVATQLGKVLGVKGVIVGTVSEYGFEKSGFSKVPSIGLNVRMIDTTSARSSGA